MPKIKHTQPQPSREKGQRSLEPEDTFLWRIIPTWLRPTWYEAEMWRNFVNMQPVAIACKDTLIASTSSLDWKIEPRESSQRDELKDEIKYYERLLQNGSDIDFIELIEWIGQDYLDLPFGFGGETIRVPDSQDGRVVWIEPLDGGTLFPTLNSDFPVGQALKTDIVNTVYFPSYAINRLYMSPRTKIERRGWGMAPPEKIYLALELLNRGDKYYASLLLDTPQAGLLDLIDMSKEDATEWIKAFQALMTGIDPFKIPVLYEHTTEARFIPFGRPPTEITFNAVTLKYAALVCAGYNMSLSDIGLGMSGNGGETLAGSIRQERKTRRTGFSRIKKKLKYFFDRILPEDLEFKWIDPDEELGVAIGRARLATATALGLAVDKRALTPKEYRLQMIADGLITISIPEDIPEDEFDILPEATSAFGSTAKKPGMLGTQVPPSTGGQGEVKSKFEEELDLGIERFLEALETKSEEFIFLPDADNIADEFANLVSDDREEVKQKISNYVKNTIPSRFAEAYTKILPYLELENDDALADKVIGEIPELRYNLIEEFQDEVINIVKGSRDVKTKKTRSRRRNNND
jgi:hypothetical protein